MQLVSLTIARCSVLIPVNSAAEGYTTSKLHLFDIALSAAARIQGKWPAEWGSMRASIMRCG
jgi:hypothetical protein